MRGQTTIDFAVGISVFLLAMSFAIAFVPGMLTPFTTGNQEETVAANRVASHLTTATLVDPDEPFVLDVSSSGGCPKEFFETAGSGGTLSVCTVNGDSLNEWIGLKEQRVVHIEITGDDGDQGSDTDLLCWDTGRDEVGEFGNANGGTDCDPVFEAGDDPPSRTGTITVARRTVLIDGSGYKYDATLEVVLWR